jgi:hypothetical protein
MSEFNLCTGVLRGVLGISTRLCDRCWGLPTTACQPGVLFSLAVIIARRRHEIRTFFIDRITAQTSSSSSLLQIHRGFPPSCFFTAASRHKKYPDGIVSISPFFIEYHIIDFLCRSVSGIVSLLKDSVLSIPQRSCIRFIDSTIATIKHEVLERRRFDASPIGDVV